MKNVGFGRVSFKVGFIIIKYSPDA